MTSSDFARVDGGNKERIFEEYLDGTVWSSVPCNECQWRIAGSETGCTHVQGERAAIRSWMKRNSVLDPGWDHGGVTKIELHCILGGELIEDEQAVDTRFIVMRDIAETRSYLYNRVRGRCAIVYLFEICCINVRYQVVVRGIIRRCRVS